MKRNKLQKFAELLSFPNAYENFTPDDPKLTLHYNEIKSMENGWVQDHYNNDFPLVVELACGRGEYTLALAERYPQKNFLGVDIKGARLWKGAKMALEHDLTNAAFLRTRIEQIYYFFKPNEIDEIWITFPDPFLKKENRRLTAPRFLDLYHPILKSKGIVHLKTDSDELYEFTLEVMESLSEWKLRDHSPDIYKESLPHPDLDILTYYEKMHLEDRKKIKYVCFERAS